MNSQVFKTLEFDKILETVKSYASMDVTADRFEGDVVSDNIKKINIMQNETEQAVVLITKKGNPPVMCKTDIRPPLSRAVRGGILSIPEILAVGRVLQTAQRLKSYPDDIECDALKEHFEALYTNKELEKRIFASIIDDEMLADDASPEL